MIIGGNRGSNDQLIEIIDVNDFSYSCNSTFPTATMRMDDSTWGLVPFQGNSNPLICGGDENFLHASALSDWCNYLDNR